MIPLIALLLAATPNQCARGQGVNDIRTFGAVADDDGDDSRAVSDALACGRPVYVPPGVFVVNRVLIPEGGSLRGAGRHASTLKVSGPGPCLMVQGTSEKGVYHFEIADLGLDGQGKGTVGIELAYAREGLIRDAYIRGFRIGLRTDQSWTNRIRSSALVHNAASNVFLGPNSNDVTLDDCQLDAGGEHGLVILGGSSGIRVSNCVVQGAGLAGIVVGSSKAITIIGGYFERNSLRDAGHFPHIDANGTSGITVIGSVFWGSQASAAVRLEAVNGAALLGNVVSDSGAPKIAVEIGRESRNVALSGNAFFVPVIDRVSPGTSPKNP